MDLDGDDIYYKILWGDGDKEDWIGPYASGEELTVGHIWLLSGKYTIEAKARDDFGGESDWASFEVIMPRSRAFRFIDMFPLLERFLSLVRVY